MPAALLSVLTIAAAAAAPSAGASPQRATVPQIAFCIGIANLISGWSPSGRQSPVVRPSAIVTFADGSWAIERLHWIDWGSSVAPGPGAHDAEVV